MTTINVSEGAYLRILRQKQKLEEKRKKLVPISEAVDVLLEVEG